MLKYARKIAVDSNSREINLTFMRANVARFLSTYPVPYFISITYSHYSTLSEMSGKIEFSTVLFVTLSM